MNQGQQPPQVQQGQQPPPPVVVFARTPATFQQNQLLNYAEKRDVEIYNKGSAALSGEQWDGKSVHSLMVRVGERAGQYGWMPMLTFGARNLVTGYGDITREEVRLAAAAIQAANDRRTQDSDMLFRCLSASIKDTVHTAVAADAGRYTFIIGGESVLDGICYLKAIIDANYTYSLSNTAMARADLSSLDSYMESLKDSNITQFVNYTKSKLQELEAANETTQDLTVNFFKGLAKAKDKAFRTWVQGRRDEWIARRYVIDANCANFMEEADNYYKDKVTLREWMALDEDQQTIVALKAQLTKKPGKENQNPNGGNPKKGNNNGKKGGKQDDWAWKKVEPKGSEAKSKSVFNKKEKKNMTYHWCSHHKLWTLHTNEECTKGKEAGAPLADKTTKASADANKKVNKQKLTMRVLATLAELPSDSEPDSP